MKVSVTIRNGITKDLKRIQKELNALPKETHKELVDTTPIDTGNARNSTKLNGNKINADYPYFIRLDHGWSKQAPNGMTKGLGEWFIRRAKQIFRK